MNVDGDANEAPLRLACVRQPCLRLTGLVIDGSMAHFEEPASIMKITNRPPLVMAEGAGSYIVDQSGKRYLDFVQGWAVNTLGHSPPELVRALSEQAARLISASPGYHNAAAIRLADRLVSLSTFDRVFFANSGAEANEGAIKLARKWGGLHRSGAHEIVTMRNAFHGRTLATMSATGKPQWKDLYEPKVPGFVQADLNDLDSVERAIGERTVAVMLEPIQGEAGVLPADVGFLRELRALTTERGLLLILDEVQTGIGRTGKLFGYEHSGVQADILTLGKGLGGGVPIAALLAREEVCCFEPGDQGGTFNGNPLVCAAADAVLGVVTAPAFLDGVVERGAYLRERLQAWSARFGHGEVRGSGLLLAVQLSSESGNAIVATALERGLLLNAPRPNVLRLMPALNVSCAEIDLMLGHLEAIAAEVGAPSR